MEDAGEIVRIVRQKNLAPEGYKELIERLALEFADSSLLIDVFGYSLYEVKPPDFLGHRKLSLVCQLDDCPITIIQCNSQISFFETGNHERTYVASFDPQNPQKGMVTTNYLLNADADIDPQYFTKSSRTAQSSYSGLLNKRIH